MGENGFTRRREREFLSSLLWGPAGAPPSGASGCATMDAYKVVRIVGKGAFGAAVLVHAKNNPREQYVVKQVDVSKMKQKEKDEAKKEIKLLASFHHPNIVRYRDSFVEGGLLHIVMDFAEGGDLNNLLKEQGTRLLHEDQVLDYFVQICLAMKHVHDRKVLHRDIKSQNVFLTQNRRVIKLGDFGIARVLTETGAMAKTSCGTPYYMSPEICDGKSYNDRSDVWSMGCLLYEMATLKCPFDARDMKGLIVKILRGAYAPLPRTFSTDLSVLVAKCLDRRPANRPSVNELLAMGVVRRRIEKFLTEAQHQAEFAHTMLHANPRKNHPHPAATPGPAAQPVGPADPTMVAGGAGAGATPMPAPPTAQPPPSARALEALEARRHEERKLRKAAEEQLARERLAEERAERAKAEERLAEERREREKRAARRRELEADERREREKRAAEEAERAAALHARRQEEARRRGELAEKWMKEELKVRAR